MPRGPGSRSRNKGLPISVFRCSGPSVTGLVPGGMYSLMVLRHNEIEVPVLESDNRAIAALSVTGPVNRFRPELHPASVRAAVAGVAVTLARRTHMLETREMWRRECGTGLLRSPHSWRSRLPPESVLVRLE